MPRKNPRFQSLKKLNVRQNWSRWSLYAISQLKPPNTASKTYFQQKWAAKAATRAYHGEQVREKKWKRMFSRNLPAVVGMDHQYLARYDGSEQATGRGMGADSLENGKLASPPPPPMTPYMQMTYHPLERRLDTAIFRALFASSVRQARQFVVHGLVKVNGKKMVYPGYWLNPGDMFQVEPSSVMFATGAPKTRKPVARRAAQDDDATRDVTQEQNKPTSTEPEDDGPSPQPRRPEPTLSELKEHLKDLMVQVNDVLAEDVKSAKDKQKFRALRQSIRRAISLWKSGNMETVSTLDTQFEFLRTQMASRVASPLPEVKPAAKDAAAAADDSATTLFSEENQARLRSAFERLRLEVEHSSAWNERNDDAPFATPWRPRDYMPAFAFIPRYLEVNQNICAAVYLRHPVARPGLAEVPTPFHIEAGQLAFNWYLRNR